MSPMTRLHPALLIGFVLSALGPCASAQPVDASHGALIFGYKQEGSPGEGNFRRFSGDVVFDAAKLKESRVRLEVDLTSVDVHDATTNAELQGGVWFNTKSFPKATFVATGATLLTSGRFEAPGQLTIKGITRKVVASFTARADAGGTLLEGQVPLKRSEFKVGEGTWADYSVLADEVSIHFKLQLPRK